MKRLFTIMMLFCAVWLTNAQTPPTIIYVTQQGAGNKNGFSWDNAMSNVQDAIDQAVLWGIKQVWVAEGTYVNTHDYWGEVYVQPIILRDGVSLYGGFAGNEPADYDLSLRNFTTNTSILDGNHSTRVLTQYNDFVNPITVDGFTIQNGYDTQVGGAYLKGNTTISNCLIRNNSAEFHSADNHGSMASGGLYCSSATALQCKIIQNEIISHYSGVNIPFAGGVASENSTISNCLIYDNTNQQGYTSYRSTGGMVAVGSTLINCNIVRNNSGLYCGSGAGNTLVNCVIWGNGNLDTRIQSNNYSEHTFSHCAIATSTENSFYNYLSLDGINYILDSENSGFPGNGLWRPNFTNPDSGDFTLKPISILLGGGSTEGITFSDVDLNGNPRRHQASVDIGCYEFTQSATYGYNGIVYVRAGGAGDSTGTSWANAMPDLETAVNTAYVLGDHWQVWVSAGTYYGNRSDADLSSAFYMKEEVNVYGGFAGNEPLDYDISLRDFANNTTILDGQQLRVVLVQPGAFETQTTWDGFTIRNGAFRGCFLSGNALLSHCNICNNNNLSEYEHRGGGIYAKSSILSYCNIYNNENTNTSYGDGGGIYCDSCIVSNCIISNNTAGDGGGASAIASTFVNCQISNNTATNIGGGIWTSGVPSNFFSCTIVNNSASHVGGVACVENFEWDYAYEEEEYFEYQKVQLTNCIVWGNREGNVVSNIGYSVFGDGIAYTNPVYASVSHSAVEGGYDGCGNVALKSTNNGVGGFFPRFVSPTIGAGSNYSGGDWHLQNNSILINRGDTTLSVITSNDIAGDMRVQQGRIDIGCYESPYTGIELPTAPASIIYVKQNGSGSQDGSSWENAMSDLDWAVSFASMYDSVQVWVAAGVYYGNTQSNNAFTMRENVNVYGGFAGNEPSDFDLNMRNISTNLTVLDGQNERRVLCQLRHFRNVTEWNGFVIQSGANQNGYGAGVHMRANGKLSHCIIRNNYGIGIYGSGNISFSGSDGVLGIAQIRGNGSGHGYFSNCLIEHNYSGVRGGSYTNCTIVSNGTESGFGGSRGGLYKNCLIWGNKVDGERSNIDGGVFYDCAVEGSYSSGYITLESTNNGEDGFYPQFIAPSAGAGINHSGSDWQLQAGSVCINHGDTIGVEVPTYDLSGNPRVQHDKIDIGCYESADTSLVVIPVYQDSIVYVTQTGAGLFDGTSWDNAMSDINKAVKYAAIYHDVKVWVASGTYYGDTLSVSTETASANAFFMRDGVNVYGGFIGEESSDFPLEQRNLSTNITNLDGQHSRRVLLQNNDFKFNTEWNGFTIQNGYAPWNGAGAYLQKNGILDNCIVSNNAIFSHGGGGVSLIGSAHLRNCLIQNNTAITENDIYTMPNSTSSYGNPLTGGVFCYPDDYPFTSTKATITNCIIRNNTGSYCGGALLLNAKMDGCLINNNTGQIGGAWIGGVNSDLSSVANCSFVNNKGINGTGGVLYRAYEFSDYENDKLSFANCVFWGNRSNGQISNVNSMNTMGLADFKNCALENSMLGESCVPLSSSNEGNGLFHPRFIAPTTGVGAEYLGGVWRLQEGSALINRGDTSGLHLPTLDLAGNPRVQQGQIDIGCYESPYEVRRDTIFQEIYESVCDSLEWNGITYMESGDYVQSFEIVQGLDSVVTLHLVVNFPDTLEITDTLCIGYHDIYQNGTEIDTVCSVWIQKSYFEDNTYSIEGYEGWGEPVNGYYANGEMVYIFYVSDDYYNNDTLVLQFDELRNMETDSDCDSVVIYHHIVKFQDWISLEMTACGSYIWHGDTLTSTNRYSRDFVNSCGCSSYEELELTVLPSISEDMVVSSCDSYEFAGITYTGSGDYQFTYDTSFVEILYSNTGYVYTDTVPACKVTTLHLTITPSVTNLVEATACDSYSWNDSIYTASGDYTQTFTTANGCDSVVTLHLTLNYAETAEFAETACDSFTWNETTYTSSGDYTQTFTNANGCDSTVTLHLTVNSSDHTDLTATACGEYVWLDSTYTASGNYSITYTNAIGCDSVVTLHLTINPIPEVAITGNTMICPGGSTVLTATGADSYMWSNGSSNPSIPVNMFGQYSVIGTSAAGCFSTASVTVLVSQPPVITVSGNTDICAGESTTLTANGGVSYMWSNGSTADTLVATTAGSWQVIGYNADGCSNMASVTVNLWQPASSNLYITSFDSCYVWFGTPRCESGDYTHTLQTIHGCDSVITLHLTLEDAITTEFFATDCDSYTWNGITYSQSGNYTQNFTAANGNDSIVTMHLTINNSVVELVNVTVCDSYEWNGQTYTSSGEYTQTFTAANGCDSVVTLHLTVNSSVTEFVEATACDSYLWNDSSYTVSGDYTKTFTAANGCDSTVTLHLTINHPVTVLVEATACDSYGWNGQTYTQSGDYVQTFTASNGCDSVVTLHLTVNDTKHVEFSDSTCTAYTWNGQTYASSGDYTQTFTAANGCDSLVTLHLTIVPTIMPVISVTGSLTACDNGSATLSVPGNYGNFVWSTGALTPTITVSEAGYYWVTATDAYGCEGVSEMVQLGGSTQIDETPAICMVDVEDSHNLLIWEELSDPDVASYHIYRENNQANVFEPLAVIPAGSANAFADSTADPSVRAWRYKITAADTCGGETPMSGYHKTVHLTINQGLGNSWNLIWTPYEGIEFASYKLYRGTANNNLQLIQTMPSTLTSFTDINPAGDALFYQIEVVMTESCTQQTRDVTYTGARSNIVYNNIPVTVEVAVSACDSYDWNGQTLNASGDYTQTFSSTLGYDSVVTLHLTVNPSVSSEFSITTEEPCYTWNSESYCASGDYTQTLQTIHGCDSVVTLHLTITVGIEDHNFGTSMTVYPNPTTGVVNVQCTMNNAEVETVEFQLFDAFGRLLLSTDGVGANNDSPLRTDENGSSAQTQIDLSHYAAGVYFVKAMANGNVVAVRKVIKN